MSPEFLILAILNGVRWNLRVVLICISLMTKNAELGASQPFCILQLRFPCFPLYPIFIGLFGSLESTFLNSLYILGLSPLWDVGLVNIFSQLIDCQFVLLTVSFALQKLCNIMRSHLSVLDLRA